MIHAVVAGQPGTRRVVRGARRLEAISGAALIGFGIEIASDAR